MAEIYRKAALDRLASPEQLDKQIRIVSPLVWIAAAAFFLIAAVVTVWGFMGSLPDKVDVSGVFTGNARVQSVYTETNGEIRLSVEKGKDVKKGDLVAEINSEALAAEIALLEKQFADTSAISLTSVEDVSSTLVANLLEIKRNWQSSSLTEEQFQAKLSELQGYLASKSAEVSSLESQYNQVGDQYLAGLSNDAKNAADYELQEKKAAYESAVGTYQTAAANVESAQQSYDSAKGVLPADDPRLSALLETLNSAQNMALNAKSAMDSASVLLADTQAAYKDVYVTQNQENAKTQDDYLEYNRIGQLYSSAFSEQKNIEGQIESLKTQRAGDNVSTAHQIKSLEEQFAKTKEAILSEYKVQLDEKKQNLKHCTITAPYDGIVTDVIVQDGQVVSGGIEALRMKSSEDAGARVICYVPLGDAKKITEGMAVKVTPSSVKESEYGHMNGVVKEVGEYNATASEIRQTLGDELFVSSLQQQGPSIQVIISLNKDETTASGYEWSNKKGTKVELTEGTAVSANVITASNAPITKLLPFLKEKLKVQDKKEK